ncbi:hypothetical protein L596_024957 [Steinernema carpocapsae]|uniref:Uncharacterized protein n=1 Tax=Steinernema carpocapsae TaxID=34508 RepID=A0A4V5ZYN7_STECR|nr:hypothetical protein L596_024957 [Steinernema carpocapsae]
MNLCEAFMCLQRSLAWGYAIVLMVSSPYPLTDTFLSFPEPKTKTDATSAARPATSRASARRAAEPVAGTARATTAASRATCPATAPTEDPEEAATATTADSRDTFPATAPPPASEERIVRRIVTSLYVLSFLFTCCCF